MYRGQTDPTNPKLLPLGLYYRVVLYTYLLEKKPLSRAVNPSRGDHARTLSDYGHMQTLVKVTQ